MKGRRKRKMENKLALKVWKMDYTFLLKNYLNPNLWEKTWTLFQYKNFEIQLSLDQISVRDQKLRFYIKVLCHKDNDDRNSYWSDGAYYSLKINDISFLKKAINSAIYECIRGVERVYYIKESDEFQELEEQYYQEKYRLRKIANDFLDEVGVKSNICREAYIDAYVEENEQLSTKLDEYIDSHLYKGTPDFWITWVSCLEDESRKEAWLNKIKERLSTDSWKEASKEAEEYIKYMDTEEYTEEMKGKLEEVVNNE